MLIIGILMAIAIPTFLSLTGGAKTNAVESDLTTASQDQATYFTQQGTYGATAAANVTAMQGVDPGINWTSTYSSTGGTKTVDTVSSSATEVVMESTGQDGNNYWVDDNQGTLTYAWTQGDGCHEARCRRLCDQLEAAPEHAFRHLIRLTT